MKVGEYYRAQPELTFANGTIAYVHVIKLLRRVPAGQKAQENGYTFKEDGYDFTTLLCNSSVTPNGQYAPVLDSELSSMWVKISPEEVLRLEKETMDEDPSSWDHEHFMKEFERRV